MEKFYMAYATQVIREIKSFEGVDVQDKEVTSLTQPSIVANLSGKFLFETNESIIKECEAVKKRSNAELIFEIKEVYK